MFEVNIEGFEAEYERDVYFKNNGDGTFRDATGDSEGLGDDSAAGMGIDVADIDLDGDWDIYTKILILGEGRAGKTSLLRRLYHPGQPLPKEKDTTKGISIYRHEFDLKNGRRFRLNVWDFGGQEIYHATRQFFLTHRSLYLLVDDTSKDHKSVSDEGFKYWLELIDVFGGHSPVLIFQNEKGGRSKSIDFGGIRGRFDNVKELYGGNLVESCPKGFRYVPSRSRSAVLSSS